MINQKQLRELVVKPTLQLLAGTIPYSEHAVELLMMTQAHETNGGHYLKQQGGPALGIYQMEPVTNKDIWDNFLIYKPQLRLIVEEMIPGYGLASNGSDLIRNLEYATAMARVHYYRDSQPLPHGDLSQENVIWELAKYAKRVWNTDKGKATVQDYFDKYMEYCR